MTLLLLILFGVPATAAYAFYLGHLIANDGLGARAASGLPRSHHPDVFEYGAR